MNKNSPLILTEKQSNISVILLNVRIQNGYIVGYYYKRLNLIIIIISFEHHFHLKLIHRNMSQ